MSRKMASSIFKLGTKYAPTGKIGLALNVVLMGVLIESGIFNRYTSFEAFKNELNLQTNDILQVSIKEQDIATKWANAANLFHIVESQRLRGQHRFDKRDWTFAFTVLKQTLEPDIELSESEIDLRAFILNHEYGMTHTVGVGRLDPVICHKRVLRRLPVLIKENIQLKRMNKRG